MKVLAIIDVAPTADLAEVRAELVSELEGSWRLYTSGVLREAFATATPTRVVFVLEAESVVRADAILRALPLVARGLCTLDLIELRPFANWSLLFGA